MSDETQVTPEQTIGDNASVETHEEVKVHPAWDKMLAELPEAWHDKVAPFLIDNDRNVQRQLEQYTPYKEFVEEGVSPELMRGGLNIARAIEADPTEVYNNLKSYLSDQGLLAEEAKQMAKDIMEEESGEDFEDMFEGEKIPKALQREIDALKAKQSEAEDYMYQQELAKETENVTIALEAEMEQLRRAHNISEAHETAIYDLMNTALSAGRDITIADAARQLQAMIGPFSPAGTQEEAPTIMGSAGGAGVPAQYLTVPKDDKGKKEMLQRMFEERQRQM